VAHRDAGELDENPGAHEFSGTIESLAPDLRM
jgi:hypothetical protein